MGSKYHDAFNKEMGNKEVEPFTRVQNAMGAMTKEILKDFPLWMRLNYLANGISNVEEDNINWDVVNSILSDNISKYDYNFFEPVNTTQQLFTLRGNVIAAEMGLGVWHVSTCRECGETIYMDKGEVSFYQEKSFELPKRCKHCRSGEPKKQKIVVISKEPVHEKTTMQLAMERAGITLDT